MTRTAPARNSGSWSRPSSERRPSAGRRGRGRGRARAHRGRRSPGRAPRGGRSPTAPAWIDVKPSIAAARRVRRRRGRRRPGRCGAGRGGPPSRASFSRTIAALTASTAVTSIDRARRRARPRGRRSPSPRSATTASTDDASARSSRRARDAGRAAQERVDLLDPLRRRRRSRRRRPCRRSDRRVSAVPVEEGEQLGAGWRGAFAPLADDGDDAAHGDASGDGQTDRTARDPHHRTGAPLAAIAAGGAVRFRRVARATAAARRSATAARLPRRRRLDHHPHERLGAAGAEQHPTVVAQLGLGRGDLVGEVLERCEGRGVRPAR